MNILKLQDAKKSTDTQGHCPPWNTLIWSAYHLEFYSWKDQTFLELNTHVIWSKNGVHTLDDVWNDITLVLFEYDFICESIHPAQIVINLPEMESP